MVFACSSQKPCSTFILHVLSFVLRAIRGKEREQEEEGTKQQPGERTKKRKREGRRERRKEEKQKKSGRKMHKCFMIKSQFK